MDYFSLYYMQWDQELIQLKCERKRSSFELFVVIDDLIIHLLV